MFSLFSQERVSEIHDYNVAKDARAEARAEERLASLKAMMEKLGLSAGQALDVLDIADDEHPGYLELLGCL